ncbi:pyridoxamine 5'-phosphate oxidase family protein [Flavobacterium sandaracinum]|uniref:Pyridoxamine 5'-phosphate oxidase family protein n=1 Tax=Flavobacterium sandaracinum TaxID=2541733 RepID=A0A4R5D1B4_9FLAO|nr:pyridoxamine 5'-phosphate oxidase family protein [Flavobacterium sandaracinum]TDE03973.1 pyridoxamine 5'-phosphate oxidase family protein [Flavobacterium sandaracinum]
MTKQDSYFITINATNYNLQGIESLAWKKLVNGSVKKKNGFRTMCVGTVDVNNSAALRIVVNRKVDESQKTIYFYTDNRSRKFSDLQKDNRITLLFYDARQRVQIVVKATAAIHTSNTVSHERWKATSPQARLGYMTIEVPNTKSEQPTLGYEERFAITKPTDAESDLFQENFTVIACSVYELEFLYLDFHGNRKANFQYENGVLVQGHWAVP